MSEEAVVEALESESESVESNDVDISGMVDELGDELFPNSKAENTVDAEEAETEDDTDDDEQEEVEEEQEEKPVKAAPQSWKKEMHEKFASLDPEVQDYIEQRENQMKKGLEQDRTDANMGRTMRDIMTPHAMTLKQQGIDEPTAVKYMLTMHEKLSSGTVEQRTQALQQMAAAYKLDGSATSPTDAQLAQRLQAIESNLARSQQEALQATRMSIEKTVDTFAKEHPHFDDLSEDIAKFISAGYELEESYEKALWANPLTRQKELDRIEKEKNGKVKELRKAEVDKAKKAKSINVRGRTTDRASTAPLGTMDDTMDEVLRSINNRK